VGLCCQFLGQLGIQRDQIASVLQVYLEIHLFCQIPIICQIMSVPELGSLFDSGKVFWKLRRYP
jgi:hypothetical protein